MALQRKLTRTVSVGGIPIGGNHPIVIQSMTNTNTESPDDTIRQIEQLAAAGCEIVRVAIPNYAAAESFKLIKRRSPLPVVADIHFDWRLALLAIENGTDKLRINPGNIGGSEKIAAIVSAAKKRRIPIRIGVNAGSLEKELLAKYNGVTAEGMWESALRQIRLLEDLDYGEIILSMKASGVALSLEAYQLAAAATDYPLHIGITESGTVYSGSVKSAVGIGALLSQGIGDTVRVSLTGDPLEEIRCAKTILKAMGLRRFGPELIACPTCGRTQIALIDIAEQVERALETIDAPIKVAVMGCAVNGPGEAREADIGIAGGKGFGLLFKKGEIIRKVPEDALVSALLAEIKTL